MEETGTIKAGRFKTYKNVRLENDVLVRGKHIITPNTLRHEVTKDFHSKLGHPGAARTLFGVAGEYVWPGMQRYIEEFCANCHNCMENKPKLEKAEPLEYYTLEDLKPRRTVAFDVAVLPWATGQYRYFLLVTDLFSKYVETMAMKDQVANTIRKALMDGWVHRHGKFAIAVSDQAKNVDGEIINQLCKEIGAEKRRSSPYHPEGNGQAERSIQTIKGLVRRIAAERNHEKYQWPALLQEATFMMNSSVNSSLTMTPFETMFGGKSALPSSITSPDISPDGGADIKETAEENQARAADVRDKVVTNLNTSKQKRIEKTNASRKKADVKVGEYVYLRNFTRKDSLDPMFKGPYKVNKRDGPSIEIQHPLRGPIRTHLSNCKWSRSGSRVPSIPEVIFFPTQKQAGRESTPDTTDVEDEEVPNPTLPKRVRFGGIPDTTNVEDEEVPNPRLPNERVSQTLDDEYKLPIAIRKPCRNKKKELPDGFVSR